MPLHINCGLTKKASKDFQSVGVSLNLTAELDQGLLTDPPRLLSEIDRIYGQAEEALDRQIQSMATGTVRQPSTLTRVVPSLPQQDGRLEDAPSTNGKSGNGAVHGGAVRPATESQLRALRAICKRHRLDLDHEAHEEFGLQAADQLDLRQASALIDLLKGRQGHATTQRRWP